MSWQNMSSSTRVVEPYKTCVQVEHTESGGNSGLSSAIKSLSTISLPISHSVFTAGTLEVLAPFTTHSGGIPLLIFSSSDNTTFVAHAVEDEFSAEQFEVIWQFKLFAQGTHPDIISETVRADILTLGGTAAAPRRTIGGFSGKEHFIGWNDEHFKRFFAEYTDVKYCEAENWDNMKKWKNLPMPCWVSAEALRGMSRSPVTAFDRSLEESIAIKKRERVQAKKVNLRQNLIKHAPKDNLPSLRDPQSKSFVNHRDRATEKRTSNLSSNSSKGPATGLYNICSMKAGYHGERGSARQKDRDIRAQKDSFLTYSTKPITSLRETKGLGAAISKTVKPFHSISARFQDRKVKKIDPLPQSTRDFIAHKIEEYLLIPAHTEAILNIIRTISPKEFDRRRNGRLIDWANMSDDLYRQLGRYISDTSKEAIPTNNPSLKQVTPDIIQFIRDNILKLPAERQQELANIMEKSVPSIDALPRAGEHILQPEQMPVQNQIMMYKYVKMHLPKGEEDQIGSGEEGEGEDDFEIDLDLDFGSDIDISVD